METSKDRNALKHKQPAGWACGNYAVTGTTLQLVGEPLAEACDLFREEHLEIAITRS